MWTAWGWGRNWIQFFWCMQGHLASQIICKRQTLLFSKSRAKSYSVFMCFGRYFESGLTVFISVPPHERILVFRSIFSHILKMSIMQPSLLTGLLWVSILHCPQYQVSSSAAWRGITSLDQIHFPSSQGVLISYMLQGRPASYRESGDGYVCVYGVEREEECGQRKQAVLAQITVTLPEHSSSWFSGFSAKLTWTCLETFSLTEWGVTGKVYF